eukprot:scaffold573531_cov32-Prasinocladus_malaysianus.AAC.1
MEEKILSAPTPTKFSALVETQSSDPESITRSLTEVVVKSDNPRDPRYDEFRTLKPDRQMAPCCHCNP